MLSFSLVAHWLACIWYVIALEEIELNPQDWDVGKYATELIDCIFKSILDQIN